MDVEGVCDSRAHVASTVTFYLSAVPVGTNAGSATTWLWGHGLVTWPLCFLVS